MTDPDARNPPKPEKSGTSKEPDSGKGEGRRSNVQKAPDDQRKGEDPLKRR